MTVTLALAAHVPHDAVASAERWLYAGEDPSFTLGGNLPRVAAGDALMRAAQRLRDPYLEWIGSLSATNASPEWWASHLAAKHPYPSLFARLCALAAARELATDGTLVVCSTPALLGELRRALPGARVEGARLGAARYRAPAAALRAAWPALRTFGSRAPAPLSRHLERLSPSARFALERTPGHRRRVLATLGAQRLEGFAGDDTALLVTWADARSIGPDGAYRDAHLGPLAAMLRERDIRVAHLPRVLLGAPFRETVAALLDSGETFAFPDLYLDEADWRDAEDRSARWAPVIADDAHVADVPAAALAREYAAEHRRAQADALTHDALAAGLAQAGIRPARLIFPWEGHAWEQALTAGVHRHLPGTEVIGYDNVNFSSFALSLYPAAAEVGLRPLPDRVVTNGPTFTEVLRASAFPADRIRTGCALRHTALHAGEPAPRDERFVLAACSIDAAQSLELIAKAHAAFGDELVVKLHPASDAPRIHAGSPAATRFEDRPIGELLPHARLMLYTYSVVAYEALAAGTPPVFVASEVFLDLDQLEPFPDVGWSARTPDELRAVAATIAGLDREPWEERAREVVRQALRPTNDACVDAFL